MNRHLVPLLRNDRLNETSVLHTYESAAIAREAEPGQFVHILVAPGAGPLMRRPFSVCETDRAAGTFTVLIKAVGIGTRLLADMAPGAVGDMLAPLGTRFDAAGARRMLMVGGGVGVAPLLFLAGVVREKERRDAATDRAEIVFCYGARSSRDFVLLDRIRPLVDRLELATDDGSLGTKGTCTEVAEREFAADTAIFTCGPNPMMNDLLKRMRRAGVEGQVSLENRMGCGIGACQGCVVPTRGGYRRVCNEGPVMSSAAFDEIRW